MRKYKIRRNTTDRIYFVYSKSDIFLLNIKRTEALFTHFQRSPPNLGFPGLLHLSCNASTKPTHHTTYHPDHPRSRARTGSVFLYIMMKSVAGPLLLAFCTFPAVHGVCNTYEQDMEVASQLPLTCEWNTYMCCWTGYSGSGGITGNTDVCRVLDYPNEGDTFEYARDDEGPVYCHGFAWGLDFDLERDILDVYHEVVNVGCTADGGYFGNLEGVPECGCIEEMPVVSNAECSRRGRNDDPVRSCGDGLLRNQYSYSQQLNKPRGEMDFNLVNVCDNNDAPEFNFDTCTENTYMCCWTENDDDGMQDNTDVCRVGQTEYPGESEGEVHCHGFVWPEDANDAYILVLAQFVENYDHRDKRGYFGNIQGAPMCGCIEDMPVVTEADCTTYHEDMDGSLAKCKYNDLRNRFFEVFPDDRVLGNLVVDCNNTQAPPPPRAGDGACSDGIVNGEAGICCHGECFGCGGSSCQNLWHGGGALGSENCCGGDILASGRMCDTNGAGAPCILL